MAPGECLAHSLANHERLGIWGGRTPRQRRQLAKAIRAQTLARDRTGAGRRGPLRRLGDDQLRELFAVAMPGVPAADVLRSATDLSRSGIYVYLRRARALGLVEERNGRLHPAEGTAGSASGA